MLDQQIANMTLKNKSSKKQYVYKNAEFYVDIKIRFIGTKLQAKNFWPRLYKSKKTIYFLENEICNFSMVSR